jgi:hypothetical protein
MKTHTKIKVPKHRNSVGFDTLFGDTQVLTITVDQNPLKAILDLDRRATRASIWALNDTTA